MVNVLGFFVKLKYIFWLCQKNGVFKVLGVLNVLLSLNLRF